MTDRDLASFKNKRIRGPHVSHTKRMLFLADLAESGNATRAAHVSGASRRNLYRLKNADSDFRAAWEEAAEIGMTVIEDMAVQRATEGHQEPVFYQGKQVGSIPKYADNLLAMLLKAYRPDRFGNRPVMPASNVSDLRSLLDTVDGVTHTTGESIFDDPGE